jgi:GNAT superfamily N-acetyltransferase
MSPITYQTDAAISAQQLADLYRNAGLRRPVDDLERMACMLKHANLIVSAWQEGRLIGVARAMTDFSYACYLSDLAVRKEDQHRGIGRRLIDCVREAIGPQSMLLLLAAPEAMDYYPKTGFDPVANGWIIKRSE